MTARTLRDPSPFKSGVLHGTLGLMTLVGSLTIGGAIVHVTGDADAASPAVRVALFEEAPSETPQLNPRLPGYREAVGFAATDDYDYLDADEDIYEPDLGVEYASNAPRPASVVTEPSPRGITINGKLVPLGQSFSQVEKSADTGPVAAQPLPEGDADAANLTETTGETTPLARYALPFHNPEGKATVSLIVGGLGNNARRTQAAIDELPPEVTLAFSPTTIDLNTWVRRARRAGHEVLIEVPMEPFDYGRLGPHPQVLQVSLAPEVNQQRLDSVLSKVTGYAGVMNYQGGQFATDLAAVDPIIQDLKTRGVAMFEDGSLMRSVFTETAGTHGLPFGKATAWLDARPEADEIAQQLLILETAALEKGAALGTGMSFPITLDLIKDWLPSLEEKGIILAPATHYAKRSVASGQTRLATLNPEG